MQSSKHYYKDAQGTQRGPQQHKKDAVRNERHIIKIKNNLQANNSRVDEAENPQQVTNFLSLAAFKILSYL